MRLSQTAHIPCLVRVVVNSNSAVVVTCSRAAEQQTVSLIDGTSGREKSRHGGPNLLSVHLIVTSRSDCLFTSGIPLLRTFDTQDQAWWLNVGCAISASQLSPSINLAN